MEEVILNQTCFRIDWPNAKALISGFTKGGKKYHQAIYCFTGIPKFPALIVYNESKSRFELSNSGENLNSHNFLPPLKYIAYLDTRYQIRNDIKLWENVCNNGLFDIWLPIAPYKRFDEASPDKPHYIGLLRIYEIENSFNQNDILQNVNKRNPPKIVQNKLSVDLIRPVLSNEQFLNRKLSLEDSIKPFLINTMVYEDTIKNIIIKNIEATNQNEILEIKIKEDNNQNFQDNLLKNFIIKSDNVPNIETTIYIDSIKIENYFSIKNIEIDNLKNKKEIYFLGENGTGKTILLQAILMVLRNEIVEEQLKINNQIIDIENQKAIIDIVEEKETEIYKEFKISAKTNNYEYEITYPNDIENQSFKRIFAYGVIRMFSSNDNVDKNGYLTLFNDSSKLTNPENWLKSLILNYIAYERGEIIEKVLNPNIAIKFLEDLINLDNSEIKIKIIGDKVNFMERNNISNFNELSHGYRTILIWASDLLSRLLDNKNNIINFNDFEAIVLVDEIDLLIHPRLAYKLMSKLKKIFPKIQWFITTHSPIITLGASEDAVFYKLTKINGETKISKPFDKPLNMTANSLLTSLLWNIETFTTNKINPLMVNDNDYINQKIYKIISEKIKNEPLITDKEVEKEIEKMLNDWLKEEEKNESN